MKRRLLLFIVCALLPPILAEAGPNNHLRHILQALGPAAKIPPEWDGIWQVTDSTFTCAPAFQNVMTTNDTLCGGTNFLSGSGYVCTGTADATSMHLTCTYDFDPFPNCQAHIVTVIDATLTGNSFSSTSTTNTTYSGTGTGCNLLPPQCSIIHTHGTRTSPAPPAFCATATLPATWGKIKEIYR